MRRENPITKVDVAFVGPIFARVRFSLKEKWAALSLLTTRREELEKWHVKVVKALNKEFKPYHIRFRRRTVRNAALSGYHDSSTGWTTVILEKKEMESFFRKRWDLFKKSYQHLLRRLKNVIRHEVVHSKQQWGEGEGDEKLVTFAEYLADPLELEARAQEAAVELFQQSSVSAYELIKLVRSPGRLGRKKLARISETYSLYDFLVGEPALTTFREQVAEYLEEYVGE